MAAPASRVVQDQNLNFHSAVMLDGSKTAKKGAFGGRKALNDISNSSKPSALPSKKEQTYKNVISKGKDFIITAPEAPDIVSKSKAPVKGQPSGRKALGHLTNTKFARASPMQNGLKKRVQDWKFMEDSIPSAIKDERFLHNHEECVKVQRNGWQFKHFLETVGLDSPLLPLQAPYSSRAESPVKEIPEYSDMDRSWTVYSSPARAYSPKSVSAFNDNWKIDDYDETTITKFKLIESPKLHSFY